MDTKHIHCMLEKMAEYGKCMVEEGAGAGNVNLEDAKKVIEMVGELAEAEYHALIAKEMRKSAEEDEAEEKYIRKMLKEENKDEYKRMREEYGEDEGERRFYDNYRYKSSGRFAPKGRGSYMPRGGRRGYEEPPYYHMSPDYRMDLEDYKGKTAEELRDMDRQSRGVMYFSSPMSDGNMSRNVSDAKTSVSGGNVRGYSDGYADGYSEGERMGKTKGGTSRYDRAKRGYEETKEMHKGNTPQEKQEKMKSLENYMKELSEDITEMIEGASNEEKTMLRSKVQTLAQKIQ